jgi:hypothetical protein
MVGLDSVFTMVVEAVCTSEMLVYFSEIIQRHISEGYRRQVFMEQNKPKYRSRIADVH